MMMKKNNDDYRIPIWRYKLLQMYCWKYPEWVEKRCEIECSLLSTRSYSKTDRKRPSTDRTSDLAIELVDLETRIDLIESIAKEVDFKNHAYILKAVTEGRSFYALNQEGMTLDHVDDFILLYHKFYYILNEKMTDRLAAIRKTVYKSDPILGPLMAKRWFGDF